jgi:hypothetical protein
MKIFSRKFYWKTTYCMRLKGKRNGNRSMRSICTSENLRTSLTRSTVKNSGHSVSRKCRTYGGRAFVRTVSKDSRYF